MISLVIEVCKNKGDGNENLDWGLIKCLEWGSLRGFL